MLVGPGLVVVVLASWLLLTCGWLLLFVLCWILPWSTQLLLRILFWTLLIVQGVIALPYCIPKMSRFLPEKLWGSANTFALCMSVPMTLYLAERLWWLSQWKYWSVWVGLWYTVMDRELSACVVIKVSRKGIAPFPWVPSVVNLIPGSMLLMWSRNSCLLDCC